MTIQSKTIEKEINDVVQNAITNGRDHLNDEEANHIIKLSENLVKGYIQKLENS